MHPTSSLPERYDQDSIGGASEHGEALDESALSLAQASLLDLADGGADGGGGDATPLAATLASTSSGVAADFGGLADLMSLGGGSSVAAAAPSPADLLGDLMGGAGPSPAAIAAPVAAAPAVQGGGLGGLDDFLGGLGGSPAAAPAAPAAASVSLVAQPQITPQEFQHKWAAWTPGARAFQQQLSPAAVGGVESNGFRVRRLFGGCLFGGLLV